jgi:hypothetical protein
LGLFNSVCTARVRSVLYELGKYLDEDLDTTTLKIEKEA